MKAKSGIYMTFLPDELNVEVSHKACSVLDVALSEGIEIDHTCGGNGTCGTCRVWVEAGLEKIGERNEIEKEMAEDRGFAPAERLACQTPALSGLIIRRPT